MDTKDAVKQATKIYYRMERAYREFRKVAGEIAMEYGLNPYEVLIHFLKVSVESEERAYKEAAKNIADIPTRIAEALGVRPEDVVSGNIEIDEKTLMKILNAVDNEDEELDF